MSNKNVPEISNRSDRTHCDRITHKIIHVSTSDNTQEFALKSQTDERDKPFFFCQTRNHFVFGLINIIEKVTKQYNNSFFNNP